MYWSAPVSSRMRATTGCGATRAIVPPRTFSTVRTLSRICMPVESMKASPDSSRIIRRVPRDTSEVSTSRSCRPVCRSHSPVRVTRVYAAPAVTEIVSSSTPPLPGHDRRAGGRPAKRQAMLGPAQLHRPGFDGPVLAPYGRPPHHAPGRVTRSARAARWWLEVPKPIESALARLRYRWAGCSQVKPIPPCICTHSSAAWTATSPQCALASAPATGVSSLPSARQAAAYRAAARAWVISTHRSASRCLRPWNEPTGRARGRGAPPPRAGQRVLEALERAHRPGELPPLLHVGHGQLQALLGHPELLGGQAGRARDQGALG